MQTTPDRSMIFGDDSSKGGPKYFVYGSLHCAERQLPRIEKKLSDALIGYDHEIKWNKDRFLDRNVQFTKALFDCWPALSYRCIVVPIKQINEAAPARKRGLLRAKLIFTHLNTYPRQTLLDAPKYKVTLDKDEFDPIVQQITLNRRFWSEHGGDYDAFEVGDLHSHESVMLQAADLITGAVAWVSNGHLYPEKYDSGGYVHHRTLADLIAKRARIAAFKRRGVPEVPQGHVETLGWKTVKIKERGFAIWHVDLARTKVGGTEWDI